jgi:hypothetical protein
MVTPSISSSRGSRHADVGSAGLWVVDLGRSGVDDGDGHEEACGVMIDHPDLVGRNQVNYVVLATHRNGRE